MNVFYLFLNSFLCVALVLLTSVVCLTMASDKTDNRNSGAGYRTKGALRSKAAWNTGNRTFGLCMLPAAVVETAAILFEDKVLIPQGIVTDENSLLINLGIFLACFLVGYAVAESRIRRLGP